MSIRKEDALHYHSMGRKGKLGIHPTKPVSTIRDLSLAYSPGVAYPCLEIAEDASKVYEYTSKGNVVAVISNGTAVLGLGNIGALASKPVMEGKAILFKKYADIDGIDIELNCNTIDEFVAVVKALEPSFGGINLEDIKAPECFEIEKRLIEALNIPVMHDDQHGTAIISSAALLNALEIAQKKIDEVRLLVLGAGAAAVSCAKLYLQLGLKKENLFMFDSKGPIAPHRKDLDDIKTFFINPNIPETWTLEQAFEGLDVFVGLSKANLVTPEMLLKMAANPIVFALANPDPEIAYPLAIQTRKDLIMATGRSDYPNQVNNVLGFPYIFRGALDVRATKINEAMKIAAVKEIAALAKEPIPNQIKEIYKDQSLTFGPNYLIPKPMDKRLMVKVSSAVAKAAIASGVATLPITDWEAYEQELEQRLGYNKGLLSSLYIKARREPKRILFPESDHPNVLQAAQVLADEQIGKPVLIGNPQKILKHAEELKIDLSECELFDPYQDPNLYKRYALQYFELRKRKGMTLEEAKNMMNRRTYFGLMLLRDHYADALITGVTRGYAYNVRPAIQIIGLEPNTKTLAGLYILSSTKGIYFFADTTVNIQPDIPTLVEIAKLTARAVRFFGLEPRIAFLSYSNFGSSKEDDAQKMAIAAAKFKKECPDALADGDIQANFALRPDLLKQFFPFSDLAQSGANAFIFPNLASANIAYKFLQELGSMEAVGPILMGLNQPVHIMQMGASPREIVNMAAVAVLDAQHINQFV